MKKILLKKMFLAACFLLISCGTVQQTIYLQDAEVKGPINTPSIRITKDRTPGTITFSPRLNVNGYSEISGNTGGERYRDPEQDSLFSKKSKNLLWMMPEFSLGMDFELALTKSFGFAAGLNYSKVDGQQLIGGSFGLAFVSEKENSAARFDLGILVQEIYFDAKSVVVTTKDYMWSDPTTSVTYYRDIGKNANINIFAGLTLNSNFQDFPVNYFLNLVFFTQSLLNYEPETRTDLTYALILTDKTVTDSRGKAMSSFLSFAPGVYLQLSDWSRFVLGARLLFDLGLEDSSNQFLVLPIVQFDMQF